jgi:hypothetical protein
MTKWYLIAIIALALALGTGWIIACGDDDDDEPAAVFDDDDSGTPGGAGDDDAVGDDDDSVDDDDDDTIDDDDDAVDPYTNCRDTLSLAVDNCALTETNTYDEMVCIGVAWAEAVTCLLTAGMPPGSTDCIDNAIGLYGDCLALCTPTDDTCLRQCETDLETESMSCGFDPGK